jgi:hypothetical protein
MSFTVINSVKAHFTPVGLAAPNARLLDELGDLVLIGILLGPPRPVILLILIFVYRKHPGCPVYRILRPFTPVVFGIVPWMTAAPFGAVFRHVPGVPLHEPPLFI